MILASFKSIVMASGDSRQDRSSTEAPFGN
jgi:hypothetical protein